MCAIFRTLSNHLAANDYYSEHERIEGVWMGELSVDFKLYGATVETEIFSLFQQKINQETGAKLTQRTVMTCVRFFDFQCAAPKSVSILALFDERLAQAHDEAVREAMDELERLAAVRIRKGDNVRTNNLENTGKIVYACFRHDASRALDPQLHTHNVVVNVTQDSEGKYKALESLEMCRAIRYAGKVYHNALSKKYRTLGYEMVNRLDEKGNITWQDIAGVPEELMELFQAAASDRGGEVYRGTWSETDVDGKQLSFGFDAKCENEAFESGCGFSASTSGNGNG